MDILYALLLMVIGMATVYLILYLMGLVVNGTKYVTEKMEKKKTTARGTVTKVAKKAKAADREAKKTGSGTKAKLKIDSDAETREMVAAAVAAYLMLKEKDDKKAQGSMARHRNVWSIAAKYEQLASRMTGGGKNYGF